MKKAARCETYHRFSDRLISWGEEKYLERSVYLVSLVYNHNFKKLIGEPNTMSNIKG